MQMQMQMQMQSNAEFRAQTAETAEECRMQDAGEVKDMLANIAKWTGRQRQEMQQEHQLRQLQQMQQQGQQAAKAATCRRLRATS